MNWSRRHGIWRCFVRGPQGTRFVSVHPHADGGVELWILDHAFRKIGAPLRFADARAAKEYVEGSHQLALELGANGREPSVAGAESTGGRAS